MTRQKFQDLPRPSDAQGLRQWEILQGDCLEVLRTMPDESVNCCVTSPPYWGLRDYGVDGQLGLEKTPEMYVAKMVEVFREVRRVLRADGTLWLNLGDSYAGSWGAQSRGSFTPGTLEGASDKDYCLSARQIKAHPHLDGGTGSMKRTPGCKPKDLIGIPWLVAFALRTDGWFLRSDIIWSKRSCMPESVQDRPTRAHEYLFLMAKSEQYFYDIEAIKEPAVYGSETRHDRIHDDHTSLPTAERNGLRPKKQDGHGRRHAGFNERYKNRKPRTSVPRGGFDGKTNELEGREAFRAITEMRNKRSVWEVNPRPYPEAHFATFPPDLIEPCIKAGCPEGGLVLDPFSGAGTTGLVSTRFNRNYVGIELNPEYVEMSRKRIEQDAPLLNRELLAAGRSEVNPT